MPNVCEPLHWICVRLTEDVRVMATPASSPSVVSAALKNFKNTVSKDITEGHFPTEEGKGCEALPPIDQGQSFIVFSCTVLGTDFEELGYEKSTFFQADSNNLLSEEIHRLADGLPRG